MYCNITIELLHNVYIWNYKIGKVALHAQQWIPASESEKEAYFGFEETNTRSSACWSPGIRGLKCSSKGSLASPERERDVNPTPPSNQPRHAFDMEVSETKIELQKEELQ